MSFDARKSDLVLLSHAAAMQAFAEGADPRVGAALLWAAARLARAEVPTSAAAQTPAQGGQQDPVADPKPNRSSVPGGGFFPDLGNLHAQYSRAARWSQARGQGREGSAAVRRAGPPGG